MSETTYDIAGIDLDDDSYTVVQGWLRNTFKATDSDGSVAPRGKQKMLKLNEQFPLTDGEGNDVFEVKAGGIVDVAGNYVLTDTQTGQDLVIPDNDYSVLQDRWTIRDAETEAKLAEITSRGAFTTLFRNVLSFGHWIPHKYEITDLDDDHVGSIEGRFSFRDTYDVSVDDASDVPTEPVIAAAMVIDAIQGNRAATRQLRYRYIRFIESGYFRLTLPWLYIGGRGIPPMSNRVEDLENQVAELQATIDGLTEELVETKERVRELEAQTEEFEDLVVSASAEQAPPRAKQAQTTAEQQAEARGTDERRDAQIVENQEPVEAEAEAADAAAEEPTDAPAEEAEDDDDDDGIIVA
ncbi:MAG: hypothetical protein V5A56_02100 [Halolamina sp.]